MEYLESPEIPEKTEEQKDADNKAAGIGLITALKQMQKQGIKVPPGTETSKVNKGKKL